MSEVMQGILVISQVLVHGAALATGFAVLYRYQHLLQTVSIAQTFNPRQLRHSYTGRRVWVLALTIPLSLVMCYTLITGQNPASIADLVGAVVITIYHLDSLKDKRKRAHA